MRLRALLLVVVAFLCWNADICDAGKKKKKKKPGSCLEEHPKWVPIEPFTAKWIGKDGKSHQRTQIQV